MTLSISILGGLSQFALSAIIGGLIWDFIKGVLVPVYNWVKKFVLNCHQYSKHTHFFRLPEDACAREVNNIRLCLFTNRDEIIRGILIVL